MTMTTTKRKTAGWLAQAFRRKGRARRDTRQSHDQVMSGCSGEGLAKRGVAHVNDNDTNPQGVPGDSRAPP